jgi:hypothetical protein
LCEFPQGLKPNSAPTRNGTAEQAAEKLVALEETADSSGLKPLGMTKIKGLRWRT